MTQESTMPRVTRSVIIATALFLGAGASFAKGLEDMPPPAKPDDGETAKAAEPATPEATTPPDGLTPKPTPTLEPSPSPTPAEASKTPEEGEKLAVESEPEPSNTERFLSNNLVVGTSVNLIWADRPGSGWSTSGSGRTGSSDVMVGVNVPNSVLRMRKSKKLRLKGTFRYNPIVVAGTYESKPYRGVWQGYHVGLEGHLKEARFKGWTAVAGVEAGLVFVYLDALDEFETPTTAEATGAILSAHAGGDWEVTPGIKVGPRVYFGLGSFQNYQIGAATHFTF
jgi:hypothetical protein